MDRRRASLGLWVCSWAFACGGAGGEADATVSMGSTGSATSNADSSPPTGGETSEPPAPTSEAAGGGATVAAPELLVILRDRYEEAWLGSAAIADLDGDGMPEIVVPRGEAVLAWHADGTLLWKTAANRARVGHPAFGDPVHFPVYLSGLWDYGDNIVAITNQVSVADISAQPGLEVVFAGFDGQIHAVSAAGQTLWSHTYTQDAAVMTAGVAIAARD